MFVHVTQPFFAWGALEDSPSLKTIKELLDAIPDGKLIESLEQARGRGRDDYPVHVLWGVLVLTVALRHPSIEACLAELERNEGLRRLIGIESETGVPTKWSMSRFQYVLGQPPHLDLLVDVFNKMTPGLARRWTTWADTAPGMPRPYTPGAARTNRPRPPNKPKACPSRVADARNTPTTKAGSPRSWNDSATSSTCWWTPTTKWR